MNVSNSYNARLFGKGLRRAYHLARFNWLRNQIHKIETRSANILEIGCFDGRAIEYLPKNFACYLGTDAGWEGGLDNARTVYANRADINFRQISTPYDLADLESNSFDLCYSLETLEHIDPDLVDGYLQEIARLTSGYFLASFPNEIGLVFLLKYLAKKLRYGGTDEYKIGELLAATLGKSERVARDQHKGFDYRKLIAHMTTYFEIVRVMNIPESPFPRALSPTIGVLARPKSR